MLCKLQRSVRKSALLKFKVSQEAFQCDGQVANPCGHQAKQKRFVRKKSQLMNQRGAVFKKGSETVTKITLLREGVILFLDLILRANPLLSLKQ